MTSTSRRTSAARTAGGRLLRLFGRTVQRVVIGVGSLVVLAALLAGVPWMLIQGIGWPLPDHLPSVDEITTWLFHGSFGTDTLLDVLAIVCWIAWSLFVLDVLASIIEAAQGVRWPQVELPSGHRRLAAVIVGGLLWALLGHRDLTPASTHGPIAAGAWSPAAATAPQHPGHTDDRTVIVAAPQDGVHDSLWRIAERHLGDGNRWQEIWQLNKHRVQHDGHVFTDPDLIRPGWTLHLPHTTPRAEPSRENPPTQDDRPERDAERTTAAPQPSEESEPSSVPTTAPTAPAAPSEAGSAAPPASSEPDPASSGADGALVALALASAVSAALVIARHRYRRRRGPGNHMPVAPFAYDLHLAHLRAEAGELDGSDVDGLEVEDRTGEGGDRDEQALVVLTPAPVERLTVAAAGGDATPNAVTPSLGVRDGVEIALDLAATRGLGLIGEGAIAAARALLVATLAEHPGAATVLVPADDLPELLGSQAASMRLPASLRVSPGIDEALAELETLTLRRAHETTDEPPAPVLLIARPPRETRRLTAVLANGARHGIVGVFLGQFPTQMCAYVPDDGTVTATPPGPAEQLRGTRLYTMPAHAADVLDLLSRAEPHPASAPLEPPAVEPAGNGHHDPAPNLTILHPAPADTAGGGDGDPADGTSAGDDTAEPDHPREPADTNEAASALHPAAVPTDNAHADTTTAPTLAISLFGPLQVLYRASPEDAGSAVEITDALQPKQAELLVLLALHPDGVTRAGITDAIWRKPAKRVGNVFSTTLSRLRAAITAATDRAASTAVLTGGGRYRLNPDVVTVDYWDFAAAVAARRAATTDDARAVADQAIINAYHGPLVEGFPADWVDTVREADRRDVVNAVSALARQLHRSDPQHTLDLLELARSHDPYNDRIYCDIMRLQARLGQPDAISRTLSLLRTRLAEIRERPDPDTIQLATALIERARTATAAHAVNDPATTQPAESK